MTTFACPKLASVPDAELIENTRSLVAKSRLFEAELIAHLAEVDQRRLYADEGFDSMFRYCTEGLRLSEASAYKRIAVARASRKFPALLERIADGRLHVSGAVALAPVLTENNHLRLLDAVASFGKREIEQVVRTMFPKADAPAYVERVPVERELALGGRASPAGRARPRGMPIAALEGCEPRARIEPLREDRFRVQFTADATFQDRLEEARALLRHQVPDGDLATILTQALGLLVEQTKRRRFGRTDRPRRRKETDGNTAAGRTAKCTGKGASKRAGRKSGKKARRRGASRHIPAHIRRAVVERDGGRCTFVAANGRRCGSREQLEFDHIEPFCEGNGHRLENLRLLCRTHNQLTARRHFGAEFMGRFERRRQTQLAPGRVDDRTQLAPGRVDDRTQLAPGRVDDRTELAPGRVRGPRVKSVGCAGSAPLSRGDSP